MCMYCERRQDVKFGWNQPKLPYYDNLLNIKYCPECGKKLGKGNN